MPYMVNGCGTWYYGKKNVEQHQGTCEACHHTTTLKSYDTILWVVIVLVPIIPLGRKRIIEECAACRRHRSLSLSDWKALRQRSLEAVDAYEKSPYDAEKALQALRASVGFRDIETFLRIAPLIEKSLFRDGKTLANLAASYDVFGRITETERLLRLAIEVDRADEVRELLADVLLRLGRPEDAEPFVAHVFDKGIPDRVVLLYRLAQVYQGQGKHEKALIAFDQSIAVMPAITQDKIFVKLRAASEKHVGTNKPVNPSKVVNEAKESESLRRFGRYAAVGLVLAILAYLVLAVIEGERCTVYLINGQARAYTASINGEKISLPPMAATRAVVSEGEVIIESSDPLVVEPKQTAIIHTSFLFRPFNSDVLALNPDHAAVIVRTRVYYGNPSAGAGNPNFQPSRVFSAGKLLHEVKGVDYAFEDLPKEVSVSSGSSGVSKVGVFVVVPQPNADFPTILTSLKTKLPKETVAEVAKLRMLAQPGEKGYLEIIGETSSLEDCAAFLTQLLSKRPVLIECHRAYQDTIERLGRAATLGPQYEAMLLNEPENNELLYLVARAITCTNPDRATALCLRASEHNPPGALGLYWLAGQALEAGDFHKAAELSRHAYEVDPKDETVRETCLDALLADSQFDKALDLVHAHEAEAMPECIKGFYDECYLHAAAGDQPALADASAHLAKRLSGYDVAQVAQTLRSQAGMMEYCAGKTANFIEALKASDDAATRCAAHLTAGDPVAAADDIKSEKAGGHSHLLVYIAAMNLGKAELAQHELDLAVEFLGKQTQVERIYAEALAGKSKLSIDDLLAQRVNRQFKVILITALGLHDPAAREACFALAKKININKKYPYLLINAALATNAR